MTSDKKLSLFNTLTRKLEPVEPIEPGHLRFYSCGPKVYTTAHIGNFRSFLTADLNLCTARAIGMSTTYASTTTYVGHLREDDYAEAGGKHKKDRAINSAECE